ncbi:hypothetical protein HFD88_007211 [Aspergillus terreus]|nr:hypothetical protein HFD88_007211 [Aspergillus terreus]
MQRRTHPPASARPAADDATPPRAKRPRAARACDRCRRKKYKCDESYPCAHCKKSGIDCVYQGNYRAQESNRSASYILDLEKKVNDLTTKLRIAESEIAATQSPSAQAAASQPEGPVARPGIDATPLSMPQDSSTPRDEISLPYDAPDDAGEIVQEEISELNQHTNGIEFHGSTSSAALLGHLQKAREQRKPEEWLSHPNEPRYSLISTLHNSSFSPSCTTAPVRPVPLQENNYYFEQAHTFMSGYFENIHFVHPLIDKEDFYLRAHELWFARDCQPDPSFVALYLSVLSFGALVRVWDEATIGGLGRFEWSRKLFCEAQLYLNYLQFSNNLDTVQCLYLMAKICQNELNPNLAYMYLGLAVRTCLAAGFNRDVRNCTDSRSGWISKTWWGLFSLEIEMSFSVGRPDTLGMDEYHNRPLPERDDSEYAIIPWMVDFAQMTHRIKPDIIRHDVSPRALRDPKWARRQKLVLAIRYYNVKMLLFRPFLGHFTRKLRHTPSELEETIAKCLDAAMRTIEVIYDIYRVHTFFRCWWYNTTYIMFATSTLLLPMSKLGICPDTLPLRRSVEMAVEILEAMEESVVARKSVEIIKHYLNEFQASEAQTAVGGDSTEGNAAAYVSETAPSLGGFDVPEWAYGFGFPEFSFEGIARLFDDLGGLPMLDN